MSICEHIFISLHELKHLKQYRFIIILWIYIRYHVFQASRWWRNRPGSESRKSALHFFHFFRGMGNSGTRLSGSFSWLSGYFQPGNIELGAVGAGGIYAKGMDRPGSKYFKQNGKADDYTHLRCPPHMAIPKSIKEPKPQQVWLLSLGPHAFRTTMCEEHVPWNMHVPPDRLSCLPTSGHPSSSFW